MLGFSGNTPPPGAGTHNLTAYSPQQAGDGQFYPVPINIQDLQGSLVTTHANVGGLVPLAADGQACYFPSSKGEMSGVIGQINVGGGELEQSYRLVDRRQTQTNLALQAIIDENPNSNAAAEARHALTQLSAGVYFVFMAIQDGLPAGTEVKPTDITPNNLQFVDEVAGPGMLGFVSPLKVVETRADARMTHDPAPTLTLQAVPPRRLGHRGLIDAGRGREYFASYSEDLDIVVKRNPGLKSKKDLLANICLQVFRSIDPNYPGYNYKLDRGIDSRTRMVVASETENFLNRTSLSKMPGNPGSSAIAWELAYHVGARLTQMIEDNLAANTTRSRGKQASGGPLHVVANDLNKLNADQQSEMTALLSRVVEAYDIDTEVPIHEMQVYLAQQGAGQFRERYGGAEADANSRLHQLAATNSIRLLIGVDGPYSAGFESGLSTLASGRDRYAAIAAEMITIRSNTFGPSPDPSGRTRRMYVMGAPEGGELIRVGGDDQIMRPSQVLPGKIFVQGRHTAYNSDGSSPRIDWINKDRRILPDIPGVVASSQWSPAEDITMMPPAEGSYSRVEELAPLLIKIDAATVPYFVFEAVRAFQKAKAAGDPKKPPKPLTYRDMLATVGPASVVDILRVDKHNERRGQGIVAVTKPRHVATIREGSARILTVVDTPQAHPITGDRLQGTSVRWTDQQSRLFGPRTEQYIEISPAVAPFHLGTVAIGKRGPYAGARSGQGLGAETPEEHDDAEFIVPIDSRRLVG